jgi:hypothetical protein
MLMMYCPNCKKNVLTERDDFSFLLAFLLAFTGLGLVIYILYHLDKKKDRCIHCKIKCLPKQLNENNIETDNVLENKTQNSLEYKPIELEKVKIKFCHNCGVELGDREDINYCALCGSNVD